MHNLSDLDRVHLLLAVQSTIKEETMVQLDTEYVNDMLKLVKTAAPHNTLTRYVLVLEAKITSFCSFFLAAVDFLFDFPSQRSNSKRSSLSTHATTLLKLQPQTPKLQTTRRSRSRSRSSLFRLWPCRQPYNDHSR